MKTLLVLLLLIAAFAGQVQAENWEQFIEESLKQSPSAKKRKFNSGKRLLREKAERIMRIDVEVPILMKKGEYSGAETLMKEALRLTIELYHARNMKVCERFVQLGILYTKWGRPPDAESALEWGMMIGEPIAGKDSIQLAGARSLLAASYYDQGKYDLAAKEGEGLLDIYLGQYGPRSPQVEEVKNFLKNVYQKR